MEKQLEVAKKNMIIDEELLSTFACKSENGIAINKDNNQDIRPMFFRDIDKIIHSDSYTRYIDKTQVYSFVKNDHITHRVLHVQLVSKIARTIGRSLKLNEDLIEAISLGHDVGHTPFGHKGENILNDICKKEGIGFFCHNGQGVRVLKDIEGLNISVQTLDGILSHDGEILVQEYKYNPNKTKEELLDEVKKAFEIEGYSKKIIPMTMEATVMRLSDVIAYIGRDIEDAITVGSVCREDLPKRVSEILGNNNSKIVDTLIKDIIINSIDKPYLQFSKAVFESLMELKEWNYKNIYQSKEANKNHETIEGLFYKLYYIYLEREMKSYNITNDDEKYIKTIKRNIIDYIAGGTDSFFLKEAESNIEGFNIENLYK